MSTIDTSMRAGGMRPLDAEGMRKRFQAIDTAAANYLGIDRETLRTRLQGGERLADIATAEGKSVDGLESALVSALNATGSTDGVDVSALVGRIVNRTLPPPPGGRQQGDEDALDALEKAASSYLGLDVSAIREALAGGSSLEELASAVGKDVNGLKDTLLDALTDGQACSAETTSLLQALVDRMLDGTADLAGGRLSTVA